MLSGINSKSSLKPKALAVFLDGLGRSWFELGNLERAEEAFQEGLILSKELADAYDVAACLMGLGRISYERGSYQEAIGNFRLLGKQLYTPNASAE